MNERINTGWYENRDISGTKYYLGKNMMSVQESESLRKSESHLYIGFHN